MADVNWNLVNNFRPTDQERRVLCAVRDQDGLANIEELSKQAGIEPSAVRSTIPDLIKTTLINEEVIPTGEVDEIGVLVVALQEILGYRLSKNGEHLLRRIESVPTEIAAPGRKSNSQAGDELETITAEDCKYMGNFLTPEFCASNWIDDDTEKPFATTSTIRNRWKKPDGCRYLTGGHLQAVTGVHPDGLIVFRRAQWLELVQRFQQRNDVRITSRCDLA